MKTSSMTYVFLCRGLTKLMMRTCINATKNVQTLNNMIIVTRGVYTAPTTKTAPHDHQQTNLQDRSCNLGRLVGEQTRFLSKSRESYWPLWLIETPK